VPRTADFDSVATGRAQVLLGNERSAAFGNKVWTDCLEGGMRSRSDSVNGMSGATSTADVPRRASPLRLRAIRRHSHCRRFSRLITCWAEPMPSIQQTAKVHPSLYGMNYLTRPLRSGRSTPSTDASARPSASPWCSGRCVRGGFSSSAPKRFGGLGQRAPGEGLGQRAPGEQVGH
jgi:hypothetical protein